MRAMVRKAGLEDSIELDSAGTGGWHVGSPPDERATQTALTRGIVLAGGGRPPRGAGGRRPPGAGSGFRGLRSDPRDGWLEPRRAAAYGARRAGAVAGTDAARA